MLERVGQGMLGQGWNDKVRDGRVGSPFHTGRVTQLYQLRDL